MQGTEINGSDSEDSQRITERSIRQQVDMNKMESGFMSGCAITNAIFNLRQLLEKHLAKKKYLYLVLVDLEKVSD